MVVGAGEEWKWAQSQVNALNGRLIVLPKMPFDELCGLTASADVGLSLDQGLHGNYIMSLPNKLFDYIHAGIPVVASPMAEVVRVIDDWNIGRVVKDSSPKGIAEAVAAVLMIPSNKWKSNCYEASCELHWEKEEQNIHQAMKRAQSAI